jgi:hypothetical protein
MTHRVLQGTALVLALLCGCGSEPTKPPASAAAPSATVQPAPAPSPPGAPAAASPASADDDPPGTCGTQVCAADQFCEDLYRGHALDARGRPLDRKKCVPLPDGCKAKPTCACVTRQVASAHCTDEGGHVYINDYPVRR